MILLVMKYVLNQIFYFSLVMLGKSISYAYPEFMAYGYSSCVVCHFNGTGGGPLNDYGRSLFAAEIAAKPFYNPKLKDSYLSSISGFLGGTRLPLDLKPYLKFRYLGMNTKFDKYPTKIERQIVMQSAIGLSYQIDANDKYFATFELGYAPEPQGADKSKKEEVQKYISREYYLRWNYVDQSWLYFGFFDKPFGIKTPDHSSFSRGYIGFGQNDQAHGIMLHKIYDSSEWFASLFAGNLQQSADLRLSGMSTLYEVELSMQYRIGGSFSYVTNKYVDQVRLSNHHKYSPSKGHMALFEVGYFSDKSKLTSSDLQGLYSVLNFNYLLQRGVNLTTSFELLNENIKTNDLTKLKTGIGLLYFPMQRVEFRTSIINNRAFTPSKANEDTFTWLGQIHLSL